MHGREMMITHKAFKMGVGLLVAVVVFGCGTGGSTHDDATPEPEGNGTPLEPASSPTAVLPDVAREPADAGRLAREDLAERLGVDPTDIVVVEVLRTELSPQQLQEQEHKSKFIPPAQLFGYEVRLRAGDLEYLYYVRLTHVVLVGPR